MKQKRKHSIINIKSHTSFSGRNKRADIEKRIGTAGHVYVFSLGFDNLYKIGKTTNLKSRQRELQASNPKLRFVWSSYTRNCAELEKILHKRMEKFWVDRELFQFPPFSYSTILEINKLANNYNQGLPLDS